MDYAILAALWNEPARAGDLGAAVSKHTGRAVSPAVIDCYLQLFERWGFVERLDGQSFYRLAERGSHYLAHIA
jgi:DNA-binding PadR family transcriptional regulator